MANWKYGKTQYGFLSTATSGGTLTLVAGSKQIQVFTGTLAHTMKLPDATTTSNGKGISFSVINQSTGAITVQDNGSNLIATVAAGSSADFLLTDVSTANGVWRVSNFASSGGGGEGFAGIVSKSANYSIVSGDKGFVIDVDCSGGAITITLPAPVSGFVVTIKDYTGNSAANPITVLPNGSELIDQAASDTISENYRAVTYLSDGANWFKMSCFSGSTSNIPGSYSPVRNSGRGVFAGGNTGSASLVMDYVTIATTGNATSFGNLTVARDGLTGCASSITGIFAGGENNSAVNQTTIDYITIATTGNANSFGSLTLARQGVAGCSSATRGVFAGGFDGTNRDNNIDYITIATLGNATSFGTLSSVNQYLAGCGSPTRGVFGGGDTGSTSNVINYITIATTGNSTSFGTLTTARKVLGSSSNSIKGTWGGGNTGSDSNVIDYITIATTGNAVSFGNLTTSRRNLAVGNCSSSTFGLFAAGATGPSAVIDYITFSTIGNATSFGNLSAARYSPGSLSNSHGGV
jgi:hypothetical protein